MEHYDSQVKLKKALSSTLSEAGKHKQSPAYTHACSNELTTGFPLPTIDWLQHDRGCRWSVKHHTNQDFLEFHIIYL